MSVTQEELARRLNLNRSSVARILSGKGAGYSEQTRQRVFEAAAELDYKPNLTARALATGATQMVALARLSQDHYSPYYTYIHYCLERIGTQHGYQLLTKTVSREFIEGPDSDQVDWPVDGILTCDMISPETASGHGKWRQRYPIVCLGQGIIPDFDCVHVDSYSGAREALQHLLSAGCQRIAFASPMVTADPRAYAYAEILGEAGRRTEYINTSSGSRIAGYQAMRDYVAEHGCPDGLFCLNDEIAIGCYTALHEAGIRIPDDVLLLGFDGLENGRLSPTPISSVVIPIEEMCTIAWDMLLQRLKDPQAPLQQRTLVPHLEVRASSRR